VILTLAVCVGIATLTVSESTTARAGAAAKKYAAVIEALDTWIAKEVAVKQLPALAVALVDDQDIVWAKGYGYANPEDKTLAGPQTVWRIGSVSKPITALALMMLVEAGKIDLDAPVSDYLPEFQPKNPFDKKIPLRQLMSHRSGLVREPP